MAEREGICLTSMMLLVGFGMSQYSSTTKADIFLSIGLLVGRECISIDYQPAQEVTRAEKSSKFHLKVERNQKTVIELA